MLVQIGERYVESLDSAETKIMTSIGLSSSITPSSKSVVQFGRKKTCTTKVNMIGGNAFNDDLEIWKARGT